MLRSDAFELLQIKDMRFHCRFFAYLRPEITTFPCATELWRASVRVQITSRCNCGSLAHNLGNSWRAVWPFWKAGPTASAGAFLNVSIDPQNCHRIDQHSSNFGRAPGPP